MILQKKKLILNIKVEVRRPLRVTGEREVRDAARDAPQRAPAPPRRGGAPRARPRARARAARARARPLPLREQA